MPKLAWTGHAGPLSDPPSGRGGRVAEEVLGLQPLVRAVVARILGHRRDHPDVDDCTHEALRRALEGHSRLGEGGRLRPWLVGIARHVAVDLLRDRSRQALGPAGSATPDGRSSLAERLPDPRPGPEERADLAERVEIVQLALDALPDEQRRALMLFHGDGLGYREIAERMNVPVGTVGTWVTRGRRRIANALREVKEAR